MTNASSTAPVYGVHSEVGTLRKVMVCAPGLAHTRLTPSNNDDLLFDDVLWVEMAKRDHFDFMNKMRDRGVEVVEMHNLLAETVADPVARAWILDRKITPNNVGLGLMEDTRAYLESIDPRALAEFLIGGLSVIDVPEQYATSDYFSLVREAHGVTEYLLPPLPNTLYTRDTTCWIYGGVTLNPLYWPVRREETLLTTAIYKFHPSFANAGINVWWGNPDENFGLATMEGGDVMPIGNGVVLIGMSERTSRQGISPGGGGPVRQGRGRAGHRRGHAQAALGHAPGHGIHLRRPRPGHPVSAHHGSGACHLHSAERQPLRHRGDAGE